MSQIADTQALNGDARTSPGSNEGSLSFELAYRDREGSVRSIAGNAAALPHTMSIRHQVVKKGAVSYRRSNVRFDQSIELADGSVVVAECYQVVVTPLVAEATSAIMTAMQGRLGAFIVATDNAANLPAGGM